MRKIETTWHYILNNALEKGEFKHTQQALARHFGFSISTVHHALEVPESMGAIRKSGKFFVLENFQKLLYYWASVRNLEKDIIFSTFIDMPVREIESLVLPEAIFAGYSAYRLRFGEPASDYSKVYIYLDSSNKQDVLRRYDIEEGANKDREPNLFVLKKSPHMEDYGKITTIPQTFVDIWNMSDWYSGEFISQLKEKMHGVLS